MALNLGELFATLRLDKGDFDKGALTAKQALKGVGAALKDVAVLGAAADAGLTAAGAVMSKLGGLASDFNEMSNVLEQAFGKARVAEVEAWAVATGDAMGRSTASVREMAGQFQSLLAPMIGSADAARPMSQAFTQLAIDISSFKNISADDAATKLMAAMAGEAEPMRRLGVNMTEASMDAYLFANSASVVFKNLSEADKATVRYNYILDQTKTMQGDAVRTGDGYANTLRRVQDQVKDLGTETGQQALPHLHNLVTTLGSMAATLKGEDFGEAFRGIASAIKEAADWALSLGISMGKVINAVIEFKGMFGSDGLSRADWNKMYGIDVGSMQRVQASLRGEGEEAPVKKAIFGEDVNGVLRLLSEQDQYNIKRKKEKEEEHEKDKARQRELQALEEAGRKALARAAALDMKASLRAGGSFGFESGNVGADFRRGINSTGLGGLGLGMLGAYDPEAGAKMQADEQKRLAREDLEAKHDLTEFERGLFKEEAELEAKSRAAFIAKEKKRTEGIEREIEASAEAEAAAAKLRKAHDVKLAEGVMGAVGAGNPMAALGSVIESLGAPGATAFVGMIGGLASQAVALLKSSFEAMGNAWKATGGEVINKTLVGPLKGPIDSLGPTFGALMAGMVGLTAAIYLLIPGSVWLLLALAPLTLALAPLIAGVGAAGVALFGLSTQTKSFEHFQKSLQGAQLSVVNAMEPLWHNLLPLVGVVGIVTGMMAQFLTAMAPGPALFEAAFQATKVLASTFAVLAHGFAVTAAGLMSFALLFEHDENKRNDLNNARNNALGMASAADAAYGQIGAITIPAATDAANAFAAMADKANDAAGALSNVPSGYKVALARFNNTAGEDGSFLPGSEQGNRQGGGGGGNGHGDSVVSGGGITIHNLVVRAENVDQLQQSLVQVAKRQSFLATGSTLPSAAPWGRPR